MARRSSRRRSSSRSKGRKSYGRRSSGKTSTRSGHSLPIVPLAIVAGGAYLLYQHVQAQKAAAATAAATAAAIAAAAPEQNLLPSLT